MLNNADITIYNYDQVTGYYYPTVFRNVWWIRKQAATVGNSGLQTADQCTIRIPVEAAEREYKPFRVWQNQKTKSSFWTLREGDKIIHGIVYNKIKSLKDFENYEYVTITGFSDNRYSSAFSKHWRVDAK